MTDRDASRVQIAIRALFRISWRTAFAIAISAVSNTYAQAWQLHLEEPRGLPSNLSQLPLIAGDATTTLIVDRDASRVLVLSADARVTAVLRNAGDTARPFGLIKRAGIRGDTIWVLDSRQRVSLFMRNGRPLRAYTLVKPAMSRRWRDIAVYGVLSDGTFLVAPIADDSVPEPVSVPLLRQTHAGIVLDTVTKVTIDNVRLEIKLGEQVVRGRQPASDEPLVGLAANGSRIIVLNRSTPKTDRSAQLTLSTFSGDGSHIFGATVRYVPVALPDSVVRGWVQRLTVDHQEDSAFVRGKLFTPQFTTPARATFVARDGSVWIHMQHVWKPQSNHYVVLDSTGAPMGKVLVDDDTLILDAAKDIVWTVSRREGRYAIRTARLVPSRN